MKGLIAGLACFIFLGSAVSAQSIYSAQGLGLLNSQGNPNNFSMGGIGVGTPTQWNINTQNPAYLVSNPFSTFQIGLNFENRNFSGNGVTGSDAGGGINFLAYAFPIKPGKWNSSFGVLPFSQVEYDVFAEGAIEGAPNNATFLLDEKGEGGLSNLFWSNGFALNKNFMLGVKTSFIFGSIQKTTRVSIFEERVVTNSNGEDQTIPILVNSVVSVNDVESYKGFNLQLGLAYKVFISDSKFFNVGLTYSPQSTLDVQFERQDSTVALPDDSFPIPQSIGFGLSYQKLNTFTVGFDMETQSWKDAHSDSDNYKNTLKLALGVNWIPDNDNISSYFKRVSYSMGFNYQELPYIVNNQGLTDFGINFGASLPVSGYSSVDLAFKVGRLGKTNNGLIKETYFRVVIGATINDRWFIKRKYD